MQPTAPDLIAALLAGPPHALGQIDAELLFVAGQYLFHSRQDGADHYKFLAPEAVRAAFATLPIDTGWLCRSRMSERGTRNGLALPDSLHPDKRYPSLACRACTMPATRSSPF